MKVRIEFPEIRSPHFPDFLRVVRKFPTFNEAVEDGRKIYSVELEGESLRSLAALQGMAPHSRALVYYLNGQLISRWEILGQVHRHLYPANTVRRQGASITLEQVLQALLRKKSIPEG